MFRCLAGSPQTIDFVAPSVLHMHALLNVAERGAVADRPSMTLIMELIAMLCLEPGALSCRFSSSWGEGEVRVREGVKGVRDLVRRFLWSLSVF